MEMEFDINDSNKTLFNRRFDRIFEAYFAKRGEGDYRDYLMYKECAFMRYFMVDVAIRDEFTNEDIGLFNRSFSINELDPIVRAESIRVPMDLLMLLMSEGKGYNIPKYWEYVKERGGGFYKYKLPEGITEDVFKVRLKRLYTFLGEKSKGWKVINWKLVKE